MTSRQIHHTDADRQAAAAADAIRTALMSPAAPTRGVVFGSPAADRLLAAMPPKAKHCPFCGETTHLAPETKEDNRGYIKKARIVCLDCGATGPWNETPPSMGENGMLDAWAIGRAKWDERSDTL